MEKKYYLYKKHPTKDLYQIKALRSFGLIDEGKIGGWVESECNLSHYGNCWVADDAVVRESALVSGDALVFGGALVEGSARVYDSARVTNCAVVKGSSLIGDKAFVSGEGVISTKRVLTASVTSHNITATDNHLAIGCECHPYEFWLENYRRVGEENCYSEREIETCKHIIRAFAFFKKGLRHE